MSLINFELFQLFEENFVFRVLKKRGKLKGEYERSGFGKCSGIYKVNIRNKKFNLVGLSNICYTEGKKEERTSEGDLQPKGRIGKRL